MIDNHLMMELECYPERPCILFQCATGCSSIELFVTELYVYYEHLLNYRYYKQCNERQSRKRETKV
jgi:hypothetical protein